MDFIQVFIYGFLLELPFFYLVFDYKPKDRGYKLISVNTNLEHPDPQRRQEAMMRFNEMIEVIRKTILLILKHEEMGWYTNPSRANCKNCPVINCPDKDKNQEI